MLVALVGKRYISYSVMALWYHNHDCGVDKFHFYASLVCNNPLLSGLLGVPVVSCNRMMDGGGGFKIHDIVHLAD